MIRAVGWLMGMRWKDMGDYKLIRFPFWAPESLIASVVDSIERDAVVAGRELKITVGHRLVRVEEIPVAVIPTPGRDEFR